MTGEFIVAEIKQHDDIKGADKIVSSSIFGETIIIDKVTNPIGTRGLLFDCESQLSEKVCYELNLHRHSNLNKDESKVGLFEDNRRIRPIRLKGVKCSAFFLSFEQLNQIKAFQNMSEIKDGTQGNTYSDIEICKKYIKIVKTPKDNKQGKAREDLTPTFKEHFDTDQALRNLGNIKEGDLVIITEKLHGTSARCGNLQVKKKLNLWTKLCGYLADGQWLTHINIYDFVVGSRRVVKSISGEELPDKQHYYDHDLWTKVSKENFEGKLEKGETVYFEIVGYDLNGVPIMGTHSNEKLKNFMDKDEYKKFIEQYGLQTIFDYGCNHTSEQSINNEKEGYIAGIDPYQTQKVAVYRITRTNEDGEAMDLSWEQVKTRCEKLGVETVPEISKIPLYNANRSIEEYREVIGEELEFEANAPSNKFPQHLREGVCIRLENGALTPKVYKHKGYNFKVLEGIIKETEESNLEEDN